ncbi:DUF2304 domain-containing protein [Colwelliaceae bacterium 6441]
MQLYQYFSAISAIVFFVLVISLIRKDSILMGAAFRWLVLSVGILILGIFPQIADYSAKMVGISYPPILPILLACLLLILKALLADIERAKTQVKIDRMAQKLAILEAEIALVKKEIP